MFAVSRTTYPRSTEEAHGRSSTRLSIVAILNALAFLWFNLLAATKRALSAPSWEELPAHACRTSERCSGTDDSR